MSDKLSAAVPDRGHVVWLTFNPQAGHEHPGREQEVRRPALVLSPKSYNAKVGLMLCCPITSRAKGYPFETALPEGLAVQGVVLADQVKSLDWRARGAEIAGRVPGSVTDDVLAKLGTLLA